MKKKGMVRIVIGAILVGFQILGLIGNFFDYGSILPPLGGSVGYNAGFLLGYFLFGIIGVLLLVFGINARKKSIEAINASSTQSRSPDAGVNFTSNTDMVNKL